MSSRASTTRSRRSSSAPSTSTSQVARIAGASADRRRGQSSREADRGRADPGGGPVARPGLLRLDARRTPVTLAPEDRPPDSSPGDRARDHWDREVFGIADVNTYIDFLSEFGLRASCSSSPGWASPASSADGRAPPRDARVGGSRSRSGSLGVVLEQAGVGVTWWLAGVALATTSLGTLVPILSDARLLPTPFGQAVLGTGVAGEFWPIIFISVFLTSVLRGSSTEVLLLIGFGVSRRGWLLGIAHPGRVPPRVLRIIRGHAAHHRTGWEFARRSFYWRSFCSSSPLDAGLEFVLGAFAAGLVVGLALDSPDGPVGVPSPPRRDRVRLPRPCLLRRDGDELRP